MKEDVKRTVYEIVIKAMEMRVHNMYVSRTLSPSAFERINQAFDAAKDYLATGSSAEPTPSPSSSTVSDARGSAAAGSDAASSRKWSVIRSQVTNDNRRPSPFQIAWDQLEKTTDADLDWAVRNNRCGRFASLVEVVMPVEEVSAPATKHSTEIAPLAHRMVF